MNGYITLEQVSHAENILLAKVNRRRRFLSNFKRMIRINERLLLPRVNEWLDWTIKQIQLGLTKMRGRTPTAKMKSITDWNKIKTEGVVILKPTLHEILVNGGNSVMRKKLVRKQERFDSIGIEAVAWSNQHSAELVTEITNKTMKGIRAYIADGVNAGKSVPTIARELRPLVGLTERNIFAVANFHEKLILDRPELTAAMQRSMTETYARRLHRNRATMIARTETANALNEGILEGYGQMGIERVDRIEDPGTDAYCVGVMAGGPYTLDESRGFTFHPNEEGTWVAAPGETAEIVEAPQKNFHKNVTETESKALKQWSQLDYRNIRKYLRFNEQERLGLLKRLGKKEYARIEKNAKLVDSLFTKYKDGAALKTLYRGLVDIDEDVYKALKNSEVGKTLKIDTTVSSWTQDKKTMEFFSETSGGNSVEFYLKGGRKTTLELDIHKLAKDPKELETILKTNEFKVTKIKEAKKLAEDGDPIKVLRVFLEEIG